MDCGTSMVKYILFIFNTLVSLIGIVGIVYGVLLLNSYGRIEVNGQVGLPPQALFPICLIAFCSIVVFISFLGCCGAIRESVCMTTTYAVFLLILLIIQLIIVVLLYIHKDALTDYLGKFVDKLWEQNSQQPGIFDAFQRSFKCCGKNGVTDYTLSIKAAPPSCCPNPIAEACNISFDTYPGCRNKFVELLTGSTENAKYAGIGLIVIELVGFIFACSLANNVRNYKRRNAY